MGINRNLVNTETNYCSLSIILIKISINFKLFYRYW